MKRRTQLLWFLAIFAATGCGPDLDYKQARYLDDNGQPFRALKAYEAFLAEYPDDPRLSEVRYRTGRIYAEVMERCREAVPLFEKVARDKAAASSAWAERARFALLSCPDFFPLRKGSNWMYVDSLSGGKNMRLKVGVETSTGGVEGVIAGEMFAGKQMILKYRRSYSKKGWSIWETVDGEKTPILKYPFITDRVWSIHRGGRKVTFKIVAVGITVKTKAGSYDGCLKVRKKTTGYPSWVYDYYCPSVGRVKTTVGVPGKENPNTELAEFRL